MDVLHENRGDRLLDGVASLLFAGAIAVACFMLSDVKIALAGGAVAFVAGAALLAKVQPQRAGLAAFEPVAFEDVAESPADELLLDDPLSEPTVGSRVVALFGEVDSSPAALVARIEDYLGRDRKPGEMQRVAREPLPIPDASAALHAALSNIRASLR